MAETLDKLSAEGLDDAVEKAFKDAEKDTYEYEGKTYTAHPAATLFPLLRGDDFDGLVASLKLNGMRHPVLLLGDQIVDGRNRFRAAKAAGVKIIFQQIDPKEDVCVVAMDMNIHRRDLKGNRRVVLASTLRRMSLRIEAMKREALARAAREAKERERAAAKTEGGGEGEGGGGAPAAESAGVGPRAADKEPPDTGGGDAAPAAGVDAAAAARGRQSGAFAHGRTVVGAAQRGEGGAGGWGLPFVARQVRSRRRESSRASGPHQGERSLRGRRGRGQRGGTGAAPAGRRGRKGGPCAYRAPKRSRSAPGGRRRRARVRSRRAARSHRRAVTALRGCRLCRRSAASRTARLRLLPGLLPPPRLRRPLESLRRRRRPVPSCRPRRCRHRCCWPACAR